MSLPRPEPSLEPFTITAARSPASRAYRLVGVPFAAGAKGQGAREAPAALRRAGLLSHVRDAGVDCEDLGDVELPPDAVAPFHSVAPIRHWPLPRLVWEATRDRLRPLLEAGHVPLVLGGDCSIFVGVAQALAESARDQHVQVLYVDGHIDAEVPRADRCVGAAAMGLRIATEPSPFWPGPIMPPSAVTVIGCSRQIHEQFAHLTLGDVRRMGVRTAASAALARCEAADALLVHFDVDVMTDAELPGSYDASADGLTLAEARTLLGMVLADERVRAIEVTEYCPGNDPGQQGAQALVELLATALMASAAHTGSAG